MTEKMLSPQEVCDILGLSLSTIYRLYNKGELPGYKVGGSLRFKPSEIQEYLERQRQKKG